MFSNPNWIGRSLLPFNIHHIRNIVVHKENDRVTKVSTFQIKPNFKHFIWHFDILWVTVIFGHCTCSAAKSSSISHCSIFHIKSLKLPKISMKIPVILAIWCPKTIDCLLSSVNRNTFSACENDVGVQKRKNLPKNINPLNKQLGLYTATANSRKTIKANSISYRLFQWRKMSSPREIDIPVDQNHEKGHSTNALTNWT